ncbi:MAG TPA: CHAD domain-containing protein [Gammaproteobacteria bacterium]|nr:CHAD domain-containing protein [Gammaproteobacteria bacterium]
MATRRSGALEPLQQSAGTVIRGHAERLVQEADAAVRRLSDLNDTQALHVSRVALRRLRGWYRAFAEELSLKRKWRRGLRRLAHSTNQARDAEVSLEWLTLLERRLDPRAMPGLARFTADLKRLRDENYREVRKELPSAWRKLARKLRRSASGTQATGPVFLRVFMASLHSYTGDFDAALQSARRTPTPAHIHALRIAGKRLRYLVETILPWHPQAGGFIREMKALHDTAGAIQDLQRLVALSEQAFLRRAGARYRRLLAAYLDTRADHRTLKRPNLNPGFAPLLWICRAAAGAQTEYIDRFRKAYLGRKTPVCVRELRMLSVRLNKLMTKK